MHFSSQSRFFIVTWCSLIWKKCCLGHSTHLTPESLDHINFSTIIPFISHFHHCWSRFAQTRASSKYFELRVNRCQIKASISRQLQARALNLSSSVKHVVIMLSLVKKGDTFCFRAKARESVHIDVEQQLLEGQHWQYVLVLAVIGVMNRLIWCKTW